MQSKLFMPKTLNVGYQNRQGTYTGSLAYIIYYDETGKLRKEKSWESWRDTKIPNQEFENEPTEGFVFNKTGGGRPSWSDRKAFCRVYDPRGFEFEIDMANLMYILECCDVVKGKGIVGELVYAWEGTELVLVPVNSETYTESKRYTDVLMNKEHIKGKDLKVGYTYIDKDEEKYIYLGKFHEYDYRTDYSDSNRRQKVTKSKAKKFFFAEECRWSSNKDFPWRIKAISSLGKKFIKELEVGCVQDFTPFQDMLEHSQYYSPVDESKDELYPIDPEFIINTVLDKDISEWKRRVGFYTKFYGDARKFDITMENKYDRPYSWMDSRRHDRKVIGVEAVVTSRNGEYGRDSEVYRGSLEGFFERFTGDMEPCFIKRYLENGKFYSYKGSVPESQISKDDKEQE
ncbi:hypothetical protein JUGLONE_215 [Bacillus phage Juglone]|uniref:Uncharacterized protein n=1 Tax=Bacillus phage Juglone TaxID=1805949 RepID=A0A143FI39_9CAUD|nr:hypothetical protein JUGLONE_215 [Bacillus phage Juglone]